MKTYVIIIVLIGIIYYLWNPHVETCKIYLFHKPSCKYCKEIEPEWVKLENKLKNTSLTPIRIDINEPENIKLKKNFKVETVPHIVKVFNNGIRNKFKGTNTYDDIIEWIYKTD